MNQSRDVFLETTIMVDAVCKDKATKEKIRKILSRYDKSYTSNYARMEFKKGALQHLIYLHGKVVNCKSISEVFEAITKLSATRLRNKLGSVLESVTNFYRDMGKTRVSEIRKKYRDITIDEYQKEMMESYLGTLIHRSWRNFDKVADEVINPTSCFVDIQGPKKKGRIYDNSPRTCDNSMQKCEVRKFFNDNNADFSKILKKLKELPEPDTETRNRIKSLKKILRVKKIDVRQKDCWNCSDAIMAMEAPQNSDIFNNNEKHYIPICEAVGKKSVGYSS